MNPSYQIARNAGPGTDWEVIVFALPDRPKHPLNYLTHWTGGLGFRSPFPTAARPCSGSLS